MFPVLLKVGSFSLHTYGVLVAAGYLGAVLYLFRRRAWTGLSEDQLWGLVYAVFIGALLGGKLAYAAAAWSSGGNLWAALSDVRYGFVFYGGVAGALGLGLAFAWGKGFDAARITGPFAVALPLGHGIGRLGCFAAGCCYGGRSNGLLGAVFTDPEALVPFQFLGVPLHPVQLFEAVGNLALAAMIHFRWFRAASPGKRGEGDMPGNRPLLAYLVLYGTLRFWLEGFRADDRGAFVMGLSPSRWVAFASGLAAFILWLRGSRGSGLIK